MIVDVLVDSFFGVVPKVSWLLLLIDFFVFISVNVGI